jgi:DNA-binding NarL/FixJ family response regulator
MITPIRPLTETEERVLALVARGLPYDSIAYVLKTSERTARAHVFNIAAKLPSDEKVPQYRRVWLYAQQVYAVKVTRKKAAAGRV